MNTKVEHTGILGVKVTTSGFDSRADSESETSYTHGSNSRRFLSYQFLKYRLHMANGSLVTRLRKCIQADGEHFEQLASALKG